MSGVRGVGWIEEGERGNGGGGVGDRGHVSLSHHLDTELKKIDDFICVWYDFWWWIRRGWIDGHLYRCNDGL